MKAIILFSKKGPMAFISHLDLQRLLLRSFRMAGITPAYSKGFNPHPRMSIALPLSVGLSSNCEYCEVEISENALPEGLQAKLNHILPEGISVRDIRTKGDETGRSIASYVNSALYEIIAPRFDGAEESIAAYMDQKEIYITRKNVKKNKEEQREIRASILGFRLVRSFNNQMMLEALLSAGNKGTLNPAVFIRSFYDFSGVNSDEDRISILRTGINFSRNIL